MNAIMIIIAEEIQEDENQNLRLLRWHIRDAMNPFEISEKQFMQLHRFTRKGVFQLIRTLEHFLPHSNRSWAIAPHFQVLAALNFLSSGSYQRKVGQDFLACMCQSSVSAMVHRVVDALNKIMNDWITFPTTEQQVEQVQMDFWHEHHFPGILGLIDGTLVAIVPLESNREHLFINRKQYHSINVMIVCDANNRILFVNASHGGRTHDSKVFLASLLAQHLHVQHENGRLNCWLLGRFRDSGYPLLPYLLTPKLNQPEGTSGWRYTSHLVQVRSKVERVIGLLKGTWRSLRKDRTLHYFPEFLGKIVNACCVLHNMKRAWRIENEYVNEVHYDPIDLEDFNEVLEELQIEREDDGVAVREAIINNYYTRQ